MWKAQEKHKWSEASKEFSKLLVCSPLHEWLWVEERDKETAVLS